MWLNCFGLRLTRHLLPAFSGLYSKKLIIFFKREAEASNTAGMLHVPVAFGLGAKKRPLCQSKNQILKRHEALTALYGKNDYFLGRSFDVFITRLRKYLQDDPSVQIRNIHGIGFILTEDGTEG